ncbi:methyltransferase family protein [Arcticibacter tournemirensis]|uniref:Class I SAM-dependent methyltransferase n=1 Tax=Arcticibacter tournemirensis TaxID=699437 RepID=A0A5M9HH96_9SPHI|nr:class I SAM-dependent methyltransferase [Arcticibacter tournemirensis]KAA8486362.1 class I SAM-dependent methyltransferase [Arcticibacter tournemirensis]TQM52180.1 methyltransferase family protein [Arcticibacter tournemirensis]
MPDKWYQNWFNSPYYHILYNQHNNAEAEFFIDNLCLLLNPGKGTRILDIASGRGRHSVYLNKKGFDVTGIDLSRANIEFSKQFENEHLHFYIHDMRQLMNINYFDIALNLFTSFGYFETEKDHVNALRSFRKSLKAGGTLVLDYFNSKKILHQLKKEETKVIEGIAFNITKKVEKGKIIKSIDFEANNHNYHYQEEVQAFSFSDFERLLTLSGFKIVNFFGDYALRPFDEDNSDRLIFICQKADV